MTPTITQTIRKTLHAALLAGAAAGPLLLAAPVQAQSAGTSATRAEAVVVTARRREEDLQDVPIAVTAFSAEALEKVAAPDITAIGQSAPNVTLEVSRGTNSTLTAFIRGVGQQDPVAGFEQGVGIYLDDVYLNRPQGAVVDIYDVQRIEVLRGPQGTLYGRNTIGGAVKYVTKRLDADAPSLRLRGAVGEFNQRDLVVSGSIPLSDTFRAGAAIASLNRDGFGRNLLTGAENYDKSVLAGRLSFEWEPTQNLFFRLAADTTRDESSPRQGYRLLRSALTNTNPLPGRFDTRAGITTFGPVRDNNVESWGVSLQAEWNINDQWTFKSITAHREDESRTPIDFDSTPLRSFDVPAEYTNEQFSQELQLLYTGEKTTAVLGAYWLDANAFNGFDAILNTLASFTLGDVDTKTWAVFGEVSYDLTEKLTVTLGGRYTEDERNSRVFRANYLNPPSPFFGNRAAVLITAPLVVNGVQVVPNFLGNRTDTAFTPRVILAYEAMPELNLYVSYSEGFKGGGFDPRGNFANADVRQGFKPEFVDSWEFGAKASLWGGRALANTAIFFADYQDVQIPGSVIIQTPQGTSFQGTVTNAGAAEFQGFEFEGTAFVTDALTAFLSVGYIDADYTEFVVNGVNLASQRKVQNTPAWTGSFSLDYSIPMTLIGEGELSLIASSAYRGKSQQFEFAIPLLDQKAFSIYDASIVWSSNDRRWRIGLHGKNLSDERYITSGYNFPGLATDDSVLAFYGNPRQVFATLDWSF